MTAPHPLLQVTDLVKLFRTSRKLFTKQTYLRAVDGIDLTIQRGEALALVGESGSGKTTVARCIFRLVEPTSGSLRFDDLDLLAFSGGGLRAIRRRMQIVFQDPDGSLNPRMRVGTAVREPIEAHRLARKPEALGRVAELFAEVGLDPSLMDRYPHELSGGQKQRVGIARALSVQPDFLVLDEPVASLDVSVQAQVINLLSSLQQARQLTYLFIAHDLAVVRHVADRVAVMYLGKVVEIAEVDDIYSRPLHPYTASLLSAVPPPDPSAPRSRIVLSGEMPSATNPPPGCPFHPRCPHPLKNDTCHSELPPLRDVNNDRSVACHFSDSPIKTSALTSTGGGTG